MSDIDRRRIAADAKMTELGFLWREGKWWPSSPGTDPNIYPSVTGTGDGRAGAIKTCVCVASISTGICAVCGGKV